MKVKICGLTTLPDSLHAIQAGADLLGFNFYPPSPRSLSMAACQEIVAGLRQHRSQILLVGVFVNASPAEIEHTLQSCDLDLAQLSGDEPPETLAALGGRAYKALRPQSAPELQTALQRYAPRPSAPACLLDAYRPGAYGGTGQAADWSLAAGLAQRLPILLAGGLTPENVAAAVAQVHPWGVDVASGVESAPGVKDPARVQAFIRQARLFLTAYDLEEKCQTHK